MRQGFQPRSRAMLRRRLFVVAVAGFLGLGLFELYQIVVPFQSANPLWREVTIGQPVIDHWQYGGQDEEGYLKFYDGGQTVLIPPDARMFDANGKFVVLEGHTPSSLTFAQPLEAIPMPWIVVVTGAVVVPAAVALVFKLRKKRWRVRAQTKPLQFLQARAKPSGRGKHTQHSRRFRARRF